MSAASIPTFSSLPNASRRLVLLAPAGSPGQGFRNPNGDMHRYEELLGDLQRFRGRTYLADGALRPCDLDNSGRHQQDADRLSWHVVALDRYGKVCGCSRYRIHPRHADFSELGVSHASLAESAEWGHPLVQSVEDLRNLARQRSIDFVEVGGWAISEELRRTTESIRIALGTYALAGLLGGCIGITTATVRHHSASVLQKIGGSSLIDSNAVEIPAYFDKQYDCEMKILKFESASPNRKFIPWIDQLRNDLQNVEVVTSHVRAAVVRRPIHILPYLAGRSVMPGIAAT